MKKKGKTSIYLTAEQQGEMYNLMNQYLVLSKDGTVETNASNKIMTVLYRDYIDKIIAGVIACSIYKFYKFSDVEVLYQEARIAVLKSIRAHQWNPQRGSIFNFFSTVISRNLMNYTKRSNKKTITSDVDICALENTLIMSCDQDQDMSFAFAELLALLNDFFSEKPAFRELSVVLVDYFWDHKGERFTKHNFSIYATSLGYNPPTINTFFSFLKRACYSNKNINDYLRLTLIDIDELPEVKYARPSSNRYEQPE